MRSFIPLGIRLICFIYLLNTILFILSILLFYSRIIVFGNETGEALSWLVRFVFIVIPLYLYFRLGQLKKDAWAVALCFHMFFLINNISGYLEYRGYSYSIIHITGLYGSTVYSPAQLLVFGISTLFNLFVLGYLYKERRLFHFY